MYRVVRCSNSSMSTWVKSGDREIYRIFSTLVGARVCTTENGDEGARQDALTKEKRDEKR